MQYRTKLIIFLIGLIVILMITQSLIGCVNMLSGSSDWCEPILNYLNI